MHSFKSYSDPGHGWVAVKRSFLTELGCLESITPFSYMKGATVYLEEDCDVATFVKAYVAKFGTNPNILPSKYRARSPIRSYESFKFENPEIATLPQWHGDGHSQGFGSL